MALRLTDVLNGWPGLVLFVLTLLCVPTAAGLSRRILLTGTIVLGWGPLLWWRPLGGSSVGRITGLWILIVVALVLWLLASPSPKSRLRRIVPTVAPVDAAPIGAVVVGTYVWSTFLTQDSWKGAFANLGRAWDFVSHFNMTHMIRIHGATINHLGSAPSGQTWTSREYPQGYHSTAASVMELLRGPRVESTARELITFNQAVGIVAIGSAVLGVAAISALPSIRRGGAITWALPIYTAAMLILGPGAILVANGYPNFLLAVSLATATITIAILTKRLADPIVLSALMGGIVGVATTWFLLLILALPSLLLVLIPWRRIRVVWSRGAIATFILVGFFGFVLLAATVDQIRTVPTNALLQAVGSTPTLPLGSVLLTAAVLTGLAALLWTRLDRGSPTDDYRTAVAAVIPLLGLVICAAYAVLQVTSRGEVSYYFWKLLYGVWALCLLVIVMQVGALLRRADGLRRLRYGRILLPALLILAATQSFGLTIPPQPTSGIGPRAPGLDYRGVPTATQTQANLMAASNWKLNHPSADTTFVALKTSDNTPLLNTMWFFSLTGGWTAERQGQFLAVDRLEGGEQGQIDGVVDSLLTRRGSTILASPTDRRKMCQMTQIETCRRIITW